MDSYMPTSKVKSSRFISYFTGPHRPILFPMWPASQKELPTPALDTLYRSPVKNLCFTYSRYAFYTLSAWKSWNDSLGNVPGPVTNYYQNWTFQERNFLLDDDFAFARTRGTIEIKTRLETSRIRPLPSILLENPWKWTQILKILIDQKLQNQLKSKSISDRIWTEKNISDSFLSQDEIKGKNNWDRIFEGQGPML